MLGRDERSVDHAPIVDLELPALILERDLGHLAVERDGGVVHPRVEAAEAVLGHFGDALDVCALADIRRDDHGPSAAAGAFVGDLAQRLLVACSEHEARAAVGRHLGGGAPDAARGAGDDDDLLFERLQLNSHSEVPGCRGALGQRAPNARVPVPARARNRAYPASVAFGHQRRDFMAMTTNTTTGTVGSAGAAAGEVRETHNLIASDKVEGTP